MIRRCTASTTTMVIAAAAASGLLVPAAARAQQEPDPNVPVQERERPAFDPLGIRLGGFLVFPSLTVLETYDSNVFAEPEDEDDDLITVIAPTVEVESNFARHRLSLGAGAQIGLHLNEEDEDYENYFAEVDGELDVTRDSALFGGFGFERETESRESPDDPEAEEPTEFDVFAGNVGFRQRFNRLNFRLVGEAATLDFEDVGGIENDDRDRNEYDAALRVGYAISPRFNLFTEGRYTIVEYDRIIAPGFSNRDSEGWEGRGGVEIDITEILFGEVFGGYRSVEFDDERFDDVTGFSFGAGLTWNITPLTTIELVGERDVDATTVGGASSSFETDILLEVHHELLRNLLVNAQAGYNNESFEGIDREDNTFLAGAGATYLVNRYLSVELTYRFSDRDSDPGDDAGNGVDDDDDFTRHLVAVGLTGRL